MDLRLEVIILPVSDVDRAKAFYQKLQFRLDADFVRDASFRVVQMTPPGSPCSIIFGTGLTTAIPGSVQGLHLVVSDIETARAELVAHGAAVSEIFHDAGGIFHHAGSTDRVAGLAPERQSYKSFASFSDPDGNGWVMQEITERLPGRIDAPAEIEAIVLDLLKNAAAAHGVHEKNDLGGVYDKDWPAWYAAHMTKALAGQGFQIVKR